jgi:hypothetical protein
MNIFKKARQAVAEVTAPTVTAEMIQREIVEKQDALLSDALSIIQKAAAKDASAKASRLKALGFTSTKEVASAEELEKVEKAAKVVSDADQEAATKYPGFKFISKDVMTEVCAKYGLVLGGVDRYKGEVPDWALAAIERSGVVKKAFEGQRLSTRLGMVGDALKSFSVWVDSHSFVGEPTGWARDHYSKDGYRIVERSNLLIAAPAKEMVVHPYEKVENGRIIQVKDPIVCVEVSGGYVVLAAWGEEGQDPRVFNSNLN